jgi:phosphopentomutase
MPRALLLILDSFGIGGAPDAAAYGDAGANTFGHIADRIALQIPALMSLGLGQACEASSGRFPSRVKRPRNLKGRWGYAVETSQGKDTPSGHWEIAGVPVTFDWGYFPKSIPAFPADFMAELIACCNLPGLLGLKHASGTDIIVELGEEHLATGKPIVYTSVDSVIQIAAHEEAFGLERLYETCRIARRLADPLNIGRVIARPFLGTRSADFTRTANRRDYAIPPPEPTLLDRLTALGRDVVSLGKIGDIFAHRGTGRIVKAAGNETLFDATLAAHGGLPDGGLIIANYVDFDTDYGHRRDVEGYAAALERFDRRVPALLRALMPDDLVVITADHGNDPTWRGTDHTRECVPVLTFAPDIVPGSFGRRSSFADIGQSIARHLNIPPLAHGTAWDLS